METNRMILSSTRLVGRDGEQIKLVDQFRHIGNREFYTPLFLKKNVDFFIQSTFFAFV